jgi:hypothetical protein
VLPSEADTDLITAGPRLHARLRESLSSEAERHLFLVYAERNGTLGFDQPALVPQVWLHYDPEASWQRDGVPPLARQRMDFLLLLPGRRRVVLEVDGKHHSADGRASPTRYAEMVRADRELRPAGYEVYRFDGAELDDREAAGRALSRSSHNSFGSRRPRREVYRFDGAELVDREAAGRALSRSSHNSFGSRRPRRALQVPIEDGTPRQICRYTGDRCQGRSRSTRSMRPSKRAARSV